MVDNRNKNITTRQLQREKGMSKDVYKEEDENYF